MLKETITRVTAKAPASCANLAVGFDILGFPIPKVFDTVTLTRRKDTALNIISSNTLISSDIEKNTATACLMPFIKEQNIKAGFDVEICKGIPLSAGMGGSAASAVAAALALNAFLETPLNNDVLAQYALQGEYAASRSMHADNIAPILFGELMLVHTLSPPDFISLPMPSLYCSLTHPHVTINTVDARAALKKAYPLKQTTQQSAHLAAFIAALYRNDWALLERSCRDVLIAPDRAHLIPEFYALQSIAHKEHALAFSISGAGPSVFALTKTQEQAKKITKRNIEWLKTHQIQAQGWSFQLQPCPALIVSIEEKL